MSGICSAHKHYEPDCPVCLASEVERLRATLRGIADADWRQWGEFANPGEFVTWAQSRANHALSKRELTGKGYEEEA